MRSSTNSTLQAPAKLWGAAPQCPWQSSTKLLPNQHKTCYAPLCQGAVLDVGSPGTQGPEGEGMNPKQEAALSGPLCLLHQEMWALNRRGWRRQGCPHSDVLALWTPPLGAEGIKGTLWKATAHRSPRQERDGCGLPREGRGWSGARLAEETS